MKHSDVKQRTLILILTGMGLLITLIVFFLSGSGSLVQVSVDGEVKETFSLKEDLRYETEGYGGGHNILVIKDGSAYIESADCPDGLCVKMGKINKKGQSVICLPNRVVVEIK